MSGLRKLVSFSLLLLFPLATLASDHPDNALLYAHGKVQLNGAGSPTTIALFSGDWVQTEAGSVANITSEGSSVLVMPNASVKFQGKKLDLNHGDVVISTLHGMAVQADDFTITPAVDKQSKFEVAENEDAVVVAARQGSVTVSDGQDTTTVQEGQHTTRQRKKKAGAAAPASGGPISGKTLALVAGVAGATAASIALVTTSGDKKCISPSGDKKCKCDPNQQGNNNCQ